MNRILKTSFELIPLLEVVARHIYLLSKNKKRKFIKKQIDCLSKKMDVENFLASNLKKGDIVIVHTRMSDLKKFGYTPKSIIESVMKYIGPLGTLFIPNMPFYDELASIKDFNGAYKGIIKYNKTTTPSWTGVVGKTFVEDFGAIRSNAPYCSLSGVGPFAKTAFKDELTSNYIFSKESSWFKIMNNGGKILFLGAEAYDSITESHLVEDSFEGFHVKDWYMKVNFLINEKEEKVFYIRKPYWNRYLTEFYNIRQLKKHNLISSNAINGVEFSCVSSFSDLFDYYCKESEMNRSTLFKIPHKHVKKG